MRYRRSLLSLVMVALVVVLAVVVGAWARPTVTQARWVVTDLGSCPGRFCGGTVAINERGQAVGIGRSTAVSWRGGKLTSLGALPGDTLSEAVAINGRGQVAGNSGVAGEEGETSHAFVWQNGKMTPVGNVGGESNAVAINDRGWVVGSSETVDYVHRAFIWQNGKMRTLEPLLGERESKAVAVNNHGRVIGESSPGTVGGGWTAVLWRNGTITSLGKFGGLWSTPTDINERGQIVGSSETNDYGGSVGFLWQNGKLRPIGGDGSSVVAINERGQMIGTTGKGMVFVWEKGKIRYIGRGEAHALNERGQIVGNSGSEYPEPVLWQGGQTIRLPLLPRHKYGAALALNEHDEIVGWSGNQPELDQPIFAGRIVLWTLKPAS